MVSELSGFEGAARRVDTSTEVPINHMAKVAILCGYLIDFNVSNMMLRNGIAIGSHCLT